MTILTDDDLARGDAVLDHMASRSDLWDAIDELWQEVLSYTDEQLRSYYASLEHERLPLPLSAGFDPENPLGTSSKRYARHDRDYLRFLQGAQKGTAYIPGNRRDHGGNPSIWQDRRHALRLRLDTLTREDNG